MLRSKEKERTLCKLTVILNEQKVGGLQTQALLTPS